MEKLYLQMYSFGEFDPVLTEGHLAAAHEMGYDGVELFGPNFAVEADRMTQLLADNQLEAISMHTSSNNVIDMIPYAKALGLKHIVIAMEHLPDLEAAEAFAEQLNEMGKQCHKNGILLGYHNHTQEFRAFGDQRIIDVILEKTDPDHVFMELDAGWCAAAGHDPVIFLHQYKDRVKLIHVKESDSVIGVQPSIDPNDMKYDENGFPSLSEEEMERHRRNVEMNCAAGKGLVDWKELRTIADGYGCRGYIVEREHSYEGERIQCLQADLNYYKKNM